MATCNIAAFLPQAAAERPHALAIVCPHGRDRRGIRAYTHLTYVQLDRWSDLIASGLLACGLERGTRTVLMVRPSLEFFALTFGLFKAGIVPVLVDPGLDIRQLKQCIAEADPQAFIGIPLAHVARLLFGWGRGQVRHVITVGRRWGWGGLTLDDVTARGVEGQAVLAATEGTETAAILFTSGSTGPAKGAVYQHRHFVGQVELIRQMYGIEPGEIDLPTFPLFALFDPALGMTTIVPQMDFAKPASVNPAMLAELIEDWGVTNVFGSPALLATVVKSQVLMPKKWTTVKRVLSAGAPVPAAVLAGMHKLLPENAQVFTPYGATESLPVASIGSREVLGETRALTEAGAGVCVGRIAPEVDARIIAIDDGRLPDWSQVRELPQGEIGEICVRGPTTTERYFGRGQATLLAKINRDGAVVHRMGDVGYFDAHGRLWYCGRKRDRVALADRTLHTAPVEEIFNTHSQVRRTALVGIQAREETLAVMCVELEEGVQWDRKLEQDLIDMADRFEVTRGIRQFRPHPKFPVDIRHNAKIDRAKLQASAQWQFDR